MRRRAIGALVVVVCAAVTGCTSAPTAPPGAGPDGARDRTPEWSVTPGDRSGPVVTAQAAGNHLVVVYERQVTVLNRRTGDQRWSVTAAFPNSLQPAEASVWVTSRALVLLQQPERRDAPGTVTVYDIASGKKRATLEYGDPAGEDSDARGRVVVTGDTLLTQRAVAAPDGDEPRHVVESVDLDTGRSLWKHDYGALVPLFGSPARGSDPYFVPPSRDPLLVPAPTLVVLRGYEDAGYRIRVVDPRTGHPAGKPAETPQDSTVTLLDDERYVAWNDDTAGCGTRATGYEVATAKPAWRLDAAAWRGEPKPKCTDLWQPLVVDKRLLTHTPDERPVLVDLATGKPDWTGPEGFYPVGVAGDVVVGRDSRRDDTVAAYRISDSRRLWSAPSLSPIQGESDTVVPGYAILTAGLDEVWTYDTRTGRKQRCAGRNRVVAAGDGWLVAGRKGDSLDDGKLELRYFRL